MAKDMIGVETVVLDLDNTLIDTEIIKGYMYEAARDLFNCDERTARAMYKEVRGDNGKVDFSLAKYQDVLFSKSARVAAKTPVGKTAVENCLRRIRENIKKHAVDIVVPGARELINFCLGRNIRLAIASVGNESWQWEKIELLGLSGYVRSNGNSVGKENCKNSGKRAELICTVEERYGQGKVGALKLLSNGRRQGENMVLFNDKPDETEKLLEQFPCLVVFLRRESKDARYTKSDFEDLVKKFGADRVFYSHNLIELKSKFIELVCD